MKYIKLFEYFDLSQVHEFMDIVKDKLLDLSDIGFNVNVEDKNSEPRLGNMIRITIDKSNNIDTNFQFKKCSYVVSDILLTNIDMNLYKKVYVIVQPDFRQNHQSERLSWIFTQGEEEAIWSFESKAIKWANPLNLSITRVEIYFE
jgi:hypothetical protein